MAARTTSDSSGIRSSALFSRQLCPSCPKQPFLDPIDCAGGEVVVGALWKGSGAPQAELSITRSIRIPVRNRRHPPGERRLLDDKVCEGGLRHGCVV